MDETPTATPQPALRRLGVFTPHGDLLCLACDHDAQTEVLRRAYPFREYPADLAAPVACPDDQGPAICETCGASCWVRGDVAKLYAIMTRLSAFDPDGDLIAQIQQLGGMSAGLVIITVDGRTLLVTDYDSDALLGEYPEGDEDRQNPTRFHDWGTAATRCEPLTPADLIDHVARKVVEWGTEARR